MAARNTIVLVGELERKYEERRAGEAGIKPGMLLQFNASDEVIKHATAGAGLGAQVIVATENDFLGRTIDDAYADEELVHCHVAQPGDVLNLVVATGQTITPAVYGTSNGDGKWKVAGATDDKLVQFTETVTTAADTFVAARVL